MLRRALARVTNTLFASYSSKSNRSFPTYWYVDCGLSQRAPRTRRLLRHVSRKFGLLVLRIIANSCRALLHVARWFCNLYQHDAARFRSGLWRPRHINLGADFQTSMAEETHLLTRYVLFGKKAFMTDTSDPITTLLFESVDSFTWSRTEAPSEVELDLRGSK